MILDGKIDKKTFIKMLKDASIFTKEEPNLVIKDGEIAIIGDIHG